jgi:ribosomal protein S18 acetylase RimI-like enzyme
MERQRQLRTTGSNAVEGGTIVVRPARSEDLTAMDASVPAPGGWNGRRLERHLAGETVLLLAFDGEACVGRAELLLAGSIAAEVQAVHPGVPEVNGVEVATQRRGRGIGRALIGAAARTALEHGHRQISIGVEPDNEGALQLYERLGFTRSMPYVDRYSIVSEDGHRQEVADACVFLIASSEIVAGGLR